MNELQREAHVSPLGTPLTRSKPGALTTTIHPAPALCLALC